MDNQSWKLTPKWIEDQILTEEYLIRGGRFMVCIILTKGGYYVTGESAPINPAEFTEELGKKYSREDAVEKIWYAEGIVKRKQFFAESSIWNDAPEGYDFLITQAAYAGDDEKTTFHRYDAIEDKFLDETDSYWRGERIRSQRGEFTIKVRPGVQPPMFLKENV